jgi:hypothetical protein
VLDDYDHQRVRLREVSPGPVSPLTIDEARRRTTGRAFRRVGPVRKGEGRGPGRGAGHGRPDLRRGRGLPQPGEKAAESSCVPNFTALTGRCTMGESFRRQPSPSSHSVHSFCPRIRSTRNDANDHDAGA